MTGMFGWVGRHGAVPDVASAMACSLQAHDREAFATFSIDDLTIGILDGIDAAGAPDRIEPAWSADGQHALWLAGEIFDAPDLALDAPQLASSPAIRSELLARLLRAGAGSLRDVDGEYQIAWWDRRTRTLRLLVDRFAALPLYWASNSNGFAFASGVRGVLMAPGVSPAPDLDAIREAVTFGGFRLGGRTNVAAVSMVPGAASLSVDGGTMHTARYWTWSDIGAPEPRTLDQVVAELPLRWARAVKLRMRGSERPGQTLSGGLDSRAILAEGALHSRRWSALTYGVPGCDDARIAERAARAAGAEWEFVPLYQGDWLGARTAYVQQTDGLIQLGDLAHLEALPQQVARMDLHLSGYIGDAVAGPTFDHVRSLADAAVAMPFYETRIGLGWDHAIERLSSATSAPEWVGSRYALFEHKLPQSTNRWSTAWRPWLRVRKPFTDYRLFDYCMTTPWALRRDLRVYERFLCRAYPALFRSIPNQKTGAPPGAGPWRLRIARAMRVARRVSRATAAATGVRLRPWSRAYVNDGVEWARPDVRGRISETILRPGSVAVDVWGKRAVQDVIDDYVCRGQGPTQVIGALYVFETYHRDLSSHCREAQRRARGQRRPAATPC